MLDCTGDGPFEHPEYVRACAAHEGSEPFVVTAGAARLILLRRTDGDLHTVYGYPHPVGQVSEDDLAALAIALGQIAAPLRVALSPLGCGALLAEHLIGRIPIAFERHVCVADLEGDPLATFGPKALGMVRRAQNRGVVHDVRTVTPDFGILYRSAMESIEADPLYSFDDAYFSTIAAAGAFEVTARDAHGVCAAAVFLVGGPQASYHLSARRADPSPEAGSVNLILLEGLRECARRGATTCILGGGMSGDPDDPLLRFKAAMATRILPRPTFRRDQA